MRKEELRAVEPDRSVTVLAGTREGMSFAWRDRQVRAVLVVVTCVGLVGFNFNTLVPLLASDTLHVSARTFGLLSAAFGLGAFAGAMATASFKRATYRAFTLGTLGFSVSCSRCAPVHEARLAGILLVGIGAAFTLFAANANALVQLAAPDHLRGRLVALYLFAFVGLAPFGSLLSGGLVEVGGTGLAFSSAGCVGLVAAAYRASLGDARRPATRPLERGSATARSPPIRRVPACDRRNWMTIFGNATPATGASPVDRSRPDRSKIEPPAHRREVRRRTPAASILRVHGGDDIVVGSAEGRETAVQIARDMVLHIEQASSRASGRRSTSGSSAPARSSRSTYNGPNSPFEGRGQPARAGDNATRWSRAALRHRSDHWRTPWPCSNTHSQPRRSTAQANGRPRSSAG